MSDEFREPPNSGWKPTKITIPAAVGGMALDGRLRRSGRYRHNLCVLLKESGQ